MSSRNYGLGPWICFEEVKSGMVLFPVHWIIKKQSKTLLFYDVRQLNCAGFEIIMRSKQANNP